MAARAQNRFLIALGSNLGERARMLDRAEGAVERALGPLLARAPRYETAPVGGAATRPFLNSALVCASALDPDEAMSALLEVEAALGRVRRERWGDRVIDLDLLLWRKAGDEAATGWRSALVTLPHPRMLERDFVLVPAAAVAPDWRVDAGGETLEEARVRAGFALAGWQG